MHRVTWPAYETAIIDLKLTQCEGWNATGKPLPIPPVTTTSGPTQPSGTLSDEQLALASRVGLEPSRCRPAVTPSNAAGALAELNCTVSGLGGEPAFLSFGSVEDLTAWFGVRDDQIADCGEGMNAEYDLSDDAVNPGRLRCFPLANGGYRVEVMLTNSLIGLAAQEMGPTTLERWVTKFLAEPIL